MYQFAKTISLCVTLLLLSSAIFAQALQGISYQAIACNSGGAAMPNQNISLRFTIHDAAVLL